MKYSPEKDKNNYAELDSGVSELVTTGVVTRCALTAEYIAAIDEGLIIFARQALENPSDNHSHYKLSNVEMREAADIKHLTGIDVCAYTHEIRGQSIRHINNRHGLQGKQDNSMADVNDLARMAYVIRNYDSMKLLSATSKGFKGSGGFGAPMIQYMKRINGTYFVVEAVPDSKIKTLQVVSAYMQKAGQVPDVFTPGTTS